MPEGESRDSAPPAERDNGDGEARAPDARRGSEAGEGDERARARGGQSASIAEAVAGEEETPGTREQRRAIQRLEPLFDGAMLLIYGVVGLLLLGVAVVALGYALATVPKNLSAGVPNAISALLSELLLVLIVVELLRTILNYIITHTASVRPFLTVAAISAVRRILSIGADLSLNEQKSREDFTRAMVELVAEGFVILVVAISLYLFSRREGHG
jgi:uncharacterized membrane protein (DUF373 family)